MICYIQSYLGRLFLLISLSFIYSCNQDNSTTSTTTSQEDAEIVSSLIVPQFNADSAYFFIKKQVDCGPRVPGTSGHKQCEQLLTSYLERFSANLIIQKTDVKIYDGSKVPMRNFIAEFNPEKKNRIMLCAHWDTRPFADQDKTNRDQPIDGANDGASGVGVLLEIARQLSQNSPQVGIDIILFDVEDYGQPDNTGLAPRADSWCLGSQYWSKNLHKKNYFPLYGILLDMVGGKDATFTMEGNSMKFAPSVMKKVWNAAAQNGYSSNFHFEETNPIIDDHVYINKLAGIPCIDIVHYDHDTPSNFGKFWHTHNDNMDIIDKKVLKAVGQTLLEVIFKENA
ncbi:MAG: M28 family peptidase [Bacteroidia bacterium]|nr:M28 family peptidase [Bacteroidia bacterium]